MKRTVFLDSGIFIAFLNRPDQWHRQALAMFSGNNHRWSTSLLVISESYSWFLHKMGEEAARNFRFLVGNLTDLKIFEVTTEHHKATERMLDRLRGSKLTYVDACSLHLLEQHEIRTVWSTDRHLGLTGAEILPRV